jgi:glucose/arabinose dehydrogenase
MAWRRSFGSLAFALIASAMAGCESARVPLAEGTGPNPTLPPPTTTLVPTVDVAAAKGWSADGKPIAGEGLVVARFAEGLDHPRWLYVLPNGDVLVAETNAPPRPEDGKGIKAAVMKLLMRKVGAATPSANRITLLRDADGDGVADFRSVLIDGLYSPFGMALVGDRLFVADTDALLSYPYRDGDTRIGASATRVATLPGGPLNHHWTKNVISSRDGSASM